jgi:hypothetical protein
MYGRPGFDYFTCPGISLKIPLSQMKKKEIKELEDSLFMLCKLIPTCMYIQHWCTAL